MNTKNPYEYLKVDCLADVEPVEPQSTWIITDSDNERITIYTSQLDSGYWVYGYMVNWARNRISTQTPTASLGLFNSQREAKLYAVGFFKLYLDYFLDETKESIRLAETSLLQASLF